MVKICRTGLLKLNFETRPKKRIFWFLPKISAGHGWSCKFFFANFQILGPLGCQGWVVIPQNVKKCQNHCTLVPKREIFDIIFYARHNREYNIWYVLMFGPEIHHLSAKILVSICQPTLTKDFSLLDCPKTNLVSDSRKNTWRCHNLFPHAQCTVTNWHAVHALH